MQTLSNMRHSRPLLEVANVCHPEVPAEQRRNVMLHVAKREGMDNWVSRLDKKPTASAILSMRMLTAMEQEETAWVEGYHEEDPWSIGSVCTFWHAFCFALLVLIMVAALW